MQSAFEVFLGLGFRHILDPNGYDHILFIIALCAIYSLRQWKQVAILVTAFTLGHSLTLALAALDLIRVPGPLIELLIPITILLTALYNVWQAPETDSNNRIHWNYGFALFFGLIHGMGFSNFFRASLMAGQENQLITQLFAFNIGVELGQLSIVAFILLAAYIGLRLLKFRQHDWNLFISGAAAGVAFIMMLERI